MQFLWKYIDEFVGKGLEWHIILELLFYASASLVTLALPLAILLSSIMTFGSMGEHYELVAMKSSGLSLQRIMIPLIVTVVVISTGAFFFSNNVWPKANLKMVSLLYDIRQTKPALNIQPGVFFTEIENYVIWVRNKLEDNETIEDVLIYDHSQKKGANKVIHAERGKMYISSDKKYLIFTLTNGYAYNEEDDVIDRPLYRSKFDEQTMYFDLTGFEMERSDEDLFKDNYQMLNMAQLNHQIDTVKNKIIKKRANFSTIFNKKFTVFKDRAIDSSAFDTLALKPTFLENYNKGQRMNILETASNMARSNKTYAQAIDSEFSSLTRSVNRYYIEWHRKLTLSVACLILFFIGAPMGAIIRKGGLGMPVVISVLFFLVFHISSISGEKLVKQGEALPVFGMWMASLILLPIGVFLTYKATTDSVLLDSEFYNKVISKIKLVFGRTQKQ